MSTINEPQEQTLEGQQPAQAWQPGTASPPPQSRPQGGDNQHKNLQGLRGWLILVGIGLFVTPIWLAFGLMTTYLPIFTSGTWGMITTSGSDIYSPVMAAVLVFEVLANLSLLALASLCIVNYFGKRKTFPKLYIALLAGNMSYLLIDLLLGATLLPSEPGLVTESASQLAGAFVPGIIWISYMLKSRRVKATFIQ